MKNKKSCLVSKENIFLKFSKINPYLPDIVSSKYFDNFDTPIQYLNYIACSKSDIYKRNLNKIEIDYQNIHLNLPKISIELPKFDVVEDLIKCVIEKNTGEINRIESIQKIFNEWISLYKFKNSHLKSLDDPTNKDYKLVTGNKKFKTSYTNITLKNIKNFIPENNNCIKNNFIHNFVKDNNSISKKYPIIHDPDTKFIFNHINYLLNIYIKSLKYNLKILCDNPEIIDFNNKNKYLSKINDCYFQYKEDEYIKINHKNTLKTYIFKKNISNTCDYIKFQKMSESDRIDIIFDKF